MAASQYWTPKAVGEELTYDWNPASGFATPAAYLAATYGVPEWAAPFFDNFVAGGNSPDTLNYYLGQGAFPYDQAGFYRPTPDGSGQIAYGPSDEAGNWGQRDAFLQAARNALGGSGVSMPLSDARNAYDRSEIPGAGYSWDQYLQKQYVNPKVVDVPGLGQFLTADSRNSFDWGLGDRSSFMDTLLGNILPAFAGAAGLNSLLTNGLGGLTGSVGMPGMAEGYGAIEASMGTPIGAGAVDAVAAAAPAAGGYSIGVPDALSSVVPPSLGGTAPQIGGAISIGGPEAITNVLPAALGGTAVDFGAGALNAAATALPAAAAGAAAGTAAGSAAGQAATSGIGGMLNSALGTNLTSGDMDLIGRLLGTGLGAIGANQQANAQQDMFSQFMQLGAPYRASLASLEANPSAYYQSPEVQGALQQGSDALARSLSAKVGNPILNPTALQEMQNYTTNGLLSQLNQRRNFLAGAGGLGVSQAAPLGAQAAQGQGNVYNALGAGINTVFGQDPYQQMASALKNVFSLS